MNVETMREQLKFLKLRTAATELDEILANAIGSDGAQPNFEQWRKGHPEVIETLKSRADTEPSVSQRPQNVWRTIMKNPITKFATAAVIIIGVLFATCTELFQLFVKSRSFNYLDLLFNLAGLPIGMLIIKLLQKIRLSSAT